MSEVQWNALMNAPNAGQAFTQAFQGAQQQRREDAIMQQRMQEHQEDRDRLKHQDAMSAVEAHRENIIKGAQLIRQLNPQDDASWQQALSMAQQAGIDIREVPQHYDPQYAQGLVKLADTFAPEKQERGQLVPFTQGGGVARYNPQTGQMETLVIPNDGSHPAGAPASGNMPRVADQSSYDAVAPGAQYIGPDGQVRVKQGGPAPQAPGNFPH